MQHFKLPAGYETIMTRYDAIVQAWRVPCTSLHVQTRQGVTHILAAGDSASPPVILLHGRAVNAVIWETYIAELSKSYRVYAVDVIGEPGKSAPSRPRGKGQGHVEWLTDVLDELHAEGVGMIGMSFGGWLALKIALAAPERIGKMVLLCPGGFAPAEWRFMLYGAFAALLPTRANARGLVRFFSAPNVPLDDNQAELAQLVLKNYRPNIEPPSIFSDAELRQITVPSLMFIGEYDRVFDPHTVVERARHLGKVIAAEIVPNAGHSLIFDAPQILPPISEFLIP
jgi:pimeloyl-ACP methyl ester carboxylesterase